MEKNELRAALGRRVRITAGEQTAEGRLDDFEQSTMTVGGWGGGIERPGSEWYVTLDGAQDEFPLDAALVVLD